MSANKVLQELQKQKEEALAKLQKIESEFLAKIQESKKEGIAKVQELIKDYQLTKDDIFPSPLKQDFYYRDPVSKQVYVKGQPPQWLKKATEEGTLDKLERVNKKEHMAAMEAQK